MTGADKAMNTQHFWIDPADVRIRIRINPEIWIRIQNYFFLEDRRFGEGLRYLNTE